MSEEKNGLQRDEFILPGGLGTIGVSQTGNTHQIQSIHKNKDHSVTITVGPSITNRLQEPPQTEDIDCEIIEPKQLTA